MIRRIVSSQGQVSKCGKRKGSAGLLNGWQDGFESLTAPSFLRSRVSAFFAPLAGDIMVRHVAGNWDAARPTPLFGGVLVSTNLNRGEIPHRKNALANKRLVG